MESINLEETRWYTIWKGVRDREASFVGFGEILRQLRSYIRGPTVSNGLLDNALLCLALQRIDNNTESKIKNTIQETVNAIGHYAGHITKKCTTAKRLFLFTRNELVQYKQQRRATFIFKRIRIVFYVKLWQLWNWINYHVIIQLLFPSDNKSMWLEGRH